MVIIRYDLYITSSGDITKFDLIKQIVAAGRNYEIPPEWNVVSLCSSVNGAENNCLIPTNAGELLGLSTLQYILHRQNDKYHLIMFLEDKFAHEIKSQEAIYELRNGILLWLETIIGEYHTATAVTNLTVLPESEKARFLEAYCITESTKNGVYLISELQILFNDKRCRLCGISETNSVLTDLSSTVEYPYIEGPTCDHCATVLRNFRPIYSKFGIPQ